MQSLTINNYWERHDRFNYRHGVSLLIATIFTALILSIPITLTQFNDEPEAIHLKLTKAKVIEEKKEIIPQEQEPIKQTQSQIVEKKKTQTVIRPEKIQIPKVKTTKPVEKKVTQKEEIIQPLPSSGQILNSIENIPKVYDLGEDFSVQTTNPYDYIYPVIEQPKWNEVVKIIDEDVDKPRVEIEFYSNGAKGSIERFMEKVMPAKQFKTKYGKKVNCVLVLVMPVCSWK
jgi:hypothetical protein